MIAAEYCSETPNSGLSFLRDLWITVKEGVFFSGDLSDKVDNALKYQVRIIHIYVRPSIHTCARSVLIQKKLGVVVSSLCLG